MFKMKFPVSTALFLCIGIFAGGTYQYCAENPVLNLGFAQIGEYARSHSPQIGVMDSQRDLEHMDARLPLQWTNPRFDYSREYVSNDGLGEKEDVFSLSKTFALPWLYAKRNQGLKHKLEALNLDREQRIRDFLGDMKSGYVTLQLLDSRLDAYTTVASLMRQLAAIIENRKQEGLLPGYDVTLINIALLNVEGKLLGLQQQRRQTSQHWRTAMGIPDDQTLHLSTLINFIPPVLEGFQAELVTVTQSPGFQKHQQTAHYLALETSVAKMGIIPDLTLTAGYKSVGPDFKGYVLGLSFDIPILNRNRAEVRKRQLALELHNRQLELFKQETLNRYRDQMAQINEYALLLQHMSSRFETLKDRLDPVVSACREGALSISDLVNILQTYIEGMENYHLYLQQYYSTIFQLETLTGTGSALVSL